MITTQDKNMNIKKKVKWNTKKIIALTMAIIVTIGTCFITDNAIEVKAASGFTYTVLTDGTAKITGYSGTVPSILTIPETIDGYSVTAIKDNAFYYKSITKVIIPNTVKTIGNGAFSYCMRLTTVNMSEGIESIGNGAFSYCTSLTTVNMSEGIESIGNSAFSGCSKLSSITIPNSVTSIGTSAFSSCSKITSITIPEGVTAINENTFHGCSGLTSISIGENIETIGNGAFSDCSGLRGFTVADANVNYCSVNGVLFNKSKDTLVIYPAGKTDTLYTIPDGTKYIANKAFYGSTNVTELIIPNTVTEIGTGAFTSCNKLQTIEIPNSITEIKDDTFRYCSKLANVTIPNSVIAIGNYAFASCNALNNITLPSNLTTINIGTFMSCKSLTSISIPSNVIEIKTEAFRQCSQLANIEFPNGLQKIGDTVFYHCILLNNITIPESVISIGRNTFAQCSSLQSITIPNNITEISDGLFDDCTSLQSITMPNGITSIGNEAFRNCTSLQSINLPENVETIGSSAFEACTSLSRIVFPEKCYIIYDEAFKGCTNLTSVKALKDIGIGGETFMDCTNLTDFSVVGILTGAGPWAFANCSSLTDMKLRHSMKINYYANFDSSTFKNCSNLDVVIHSYYDAYMLPSTPYSEGCKSMTFEKCRFSDWVEIDVNDASTYKFISDVFPDADITNISMLLDNAKERTGVTLEKLQDGNNRLYGRICTILNDNYELKIVHTHTYGEPTFTWSSDYSECTATFVCTSNDDTQIRQCIITKNTTNPTCTVDGEHKYTAKVMFNGTDYSDVKTVPISATEHTYGEPTFIWSEEDENDDGQPDCIAEFECTSDDDTQTEDCIVSSITSDGNCTEKGKITYTATVIFQGTTYTDTKVVDTDELGHQFNSNWITIDINDVDSYAAITAINNSVVDLDSLLANAENEIDKTLLDDSNNKLRYRICSRMQDAYELKVEHTHKYGKPTFIWSEDYESCKAEFKCTSGDDTKVLDCVVSKSGTQETCTQPGEFNYIAKVTFEGNNYSDSKTKIIPNTGHTYDKPEFIWSDNYETCKAKFTCVKQDDTQLLDCDVAKTITETTCTIDGKTKYVATIVFKGNTYSDNKIKSDGALGHIYDEPEFIWSDDYENCKAKFTCIRNDDTQLVDCIIKQKITEATCTEAGVTEYVASATFKGKSYTDTKTKDIESLGHKFGDWYTVKEPTYFEDGLQHRDCIRKDKTETRTIPKNTKAAVVDGYLRDDNGNPIKNSKVEMHSDPMYTYTDENGYFKFEDVEIGDHTLKVFDASNNVICEFALNIDIEESDVNDNYVSDKFKWDSTINESNVNLRIDGIKVNPPFTGSPETGVDSHIQLYFILFVLSFGSLVSLVVTCRRKKESCE